MMSERSQERLELNLSEVPAMRPAARESRALIAGEMKRIPLPDVGWNRLSAESKGTNPRINIKSGRKGYATEC